ncbi:uncharacterized protein LOC123293027 [Chrysoperla carnea]|uniref:uncharacterized protein LOC123293027 n=1 Tax=Chrysoperla carnea TaxID=189513 RepID=UPI001D0659E8|nr:uncharacterized protein LOC123293027 [Chrysoperla carnea]
MYSLELLLTTILQKYFLNQTYLITINSLPATSTNLNYDFDKILLNSLELGCDSFIIEKANVFDFLETFNFNVQLTIQNKHKRKFIFIINKNDDNMSLINTVLTSKTYKIVTREMDDPKLILVDYWFKDNQSFLFNANLFPSKVKNLYKMPLNVTTIPTFPPYLVIENPVGWGNIFKNGTTNGVVGNVIQNKHNVALGGMVLEAYTSKFLEFAYGIINVRSICLVPTPRKQNKFLLVTFPFTLSMWIVIFCTMITLSIILSYLIQKEQSINRKPRKRPLLWIVQPQSTYFKRQILFKTLNGFGKASFIIYYLTILQSVSNKLLISKFTHRLIFGLSFIHALVISSAYISGLSAILTLPQYEKPIRTLQDLIDSKMEWGTNAYGWIYPLIDSNHSVITELIRTFKVYDNEKLRSLPPRKFAHIVDELSDGSYITPDFLSKTAIETLQLMDQEIYNANPHALFRKSSPFLLEYNKFLLRLEQSGIVAQIIEQVKMAVLA